MSLIPMTVLQESSGRAAKTILIPTETIFKIIPAIPGKPVPKDVIKYDAINRSGFARSLGHEMTEKEAASKGLEIESYLNYFIRMANPHTKSILIVQHPTGTGYTQSYFQMPHSVMQIAAREHSLASYRKAKYPGLLRRVVQKVFKIA